MTAHSKLSVTVCGAMDRMCEAEGICLMSVRGILVEMGKMGFTGDSEVCEGIEISEANENAVESSKVVSSILLVASCDETRFSMRA